eukprot:256931-Pyramimonas_sp.AAC.1
MLMHIYTRAFVIIVSRVPICHEHWSLQPFHRPCFLISVLRFLICNAASAGTPFGYVALKSGFWTGTFYVSEDVMLYYQGLISSGAVMLCYVMPWPRYNVRFP